MELTDVPVNTQIKFPEHLHFSAEKTRVYQFLFSEIFMMRNKSYREKVFEKKVIEMIDEIKPNFQLMYLYLTNPDISSCQKFVDKLTEII